MLALLFRFGAWLLGGLVAMLPTFVGQVLISLGIGVVTYTGMSTTLDWLKSGAVNALFDLPSSIIGILALMKVGSCISMVFSAIVIRLTVQGLSSDTVKRFVKR